MNTTWLHADRAITGDGRTVTAPAWLEIEGDRIKTITQHGPADVTRETVIELGDVTLTPGLINLHDHVSKKSLRDDTSGRPFAERAKELMSEPMEYLLLHCVHNVKAALGEGITWVRDYGLAGYTVVYLKRAIGTALVDGPELSVSGRPICMTGGHTNANCYEADGPYEVIKAVRSEIKAGADIIKFMASGGLANFPKEDPRHCEFTLEELKAGVEVAHDAGFKTAAHVYPTAAILRVLHAGIDSVQHGVLIDDECIELMVKRGANLVPTMSGIRGPYYTKHTSPQDLAMRPMLEERIFKPHAISVGKAVKAGILVGTGTDSFGRLADEIRFIGEAAEEMPVQALAHATGIAAKILDRSDIGLLEAGRRADIAAFPGDLTKSLAALDRAVQVWVRGVAVL